ncbi:MAG: DUF4332 domain-containing protein [Candidatus Hodarchaeales archaeon]|jgi:hypothetical protein
MMFHSPAQQNDGVVAKMDEAGFRTFLKKSRRSQSAIERCILFTRGFEDYLSEHKEGKPLGKAAPEDLRSFVRWGEAEKENINGYLWGLRYYYEYHSNEEMRWLAGQLREQRIKRTPVALKELRGVPMEYIEKLASIGIRNVKQLLAAGQTEPEQKALAEKSGVPPEAIEEFVKLSDLTRIPGIKGIRARLYYDAGVTNLEQMAQWDPEELRAMLVEFIERTKFEGLAPWPSEARYSVETAKKLIKRV